MKNNRQRDKRRHHPGHRNHHPRQQRKQHPSSQHHAPAPDREIFGVVDILPNGIGFLRQIERDLLASDEDVFLPSGLIRDANLRSGMHVKGIAKQNAQRKFALAKVFEIFYRDEKLSNRRICKIHESIMDQTGFGSRIPQ